MAVSAFQKLMNKLLQQFVKVNGRHPQTPKEYMDLQNEAVQFFNKTKGVPPGPQKPPFQGFTPKVIEGGKGKKDRPSIRLIKNFDQELDDISLAKEGYNLQEIGILKRARQVMKDEGQNPDDALSWVRSEMADDAGIDFEDFMADFDWGDFPGKAEGGIARAGFPFGGKALKAIRDAWRANKTWGVGGPPYKPEATSFNVKEMTKRNLGTELSLSDLRDLSKSPLMERGGQTFNQFNQEFKIIKARVLKQKLEESKLHAEAMIKSADVVAADNATAKKVKAQFTREGKKQLAEAIEGLKEIDIYTGMLQKQGRSVHQSGGLAYMLGEPNTRIEALQHAGVIADPRGLYTDPSIYSKGESEIPENYYEGGGVGRGPWTRGQAPRPPEQAPQPGAPMHPAQGQSNPMKLPQGLPSLAPRTMDPKYIQQQKMQQMMTAMGQQGQQRPAMGGGGIIKLLKGFLKKKKPEPKEFMWGVDGKKIDLAPLRKKHGLDKETVKKEEEAFKLRLQEILAKHSTKHADGGRIGFGLGGINKGRRAFMKWLAGILGTGVAAGTGLIKLGKAAKVVPKIAETVATAGSGTGMPAWFPAFVQKALKHGEDVSSANAPAERIIVSKTKLPNSKTDVYVEHDLVTGDTTVDIGMGKHGWSDGYHGQPTRLVLKKGEWIEPTKGKPGVKTKDEFYVEEAEFTGGHPENVKFEESSFNNYGEHGSDFSELEEFATGKVTKESKAQKQVWEADWDDSLPDSEDFASGGLAYMLGE